MALNNIELAGESITDSSESISSNGYEFIVHTDYVKEDISRIGHFYIELKEYKDNTDLTTSNYYGDYPSIAMKTAVTAIIKNDEVRSLNAENKYQKFPSKVIKLSELEYLAVHKFAENTKQNPGEYIAGFDDCASFIDEAYHATGREGHISWFYTRQELNLIPTIASDIMSYTHNTGDDYHIVTSSDINKIVAKYKINTNFIIPMEMNKQLSGNNVDQNILKKFLVKNCAVVDRCS